MGITTSNFDSIVRLIETSNYSDLIACIQNGVCTLEELEKYCSFPNPNDIYSRTLLHHAVWKEDSQALEILFGLCKNIEVESMDSFGMSPLAASVNRGNIQAARFLLEKNASLNCDKHNGYFLLRTAVYNNKQEMVDCLLDFKCQSMDPKTDMEFGSLLHIACDAGNLIILKSLVEKGDIPIEIRDKFEIQCVHIAASKNYLEIIKYLISKGADINAQDSMQNVPLGWANFSDSHDLIKYLKDLKAVDKPFRNLKDSTRKFNDFQQIAIKLKEVDLNEPGSRDSIQMSKIHAPISEQLLGVVNFSYQNNEK